MRRERVGMKWECGENGSEGNGTMSIRSGFTAEENELEGRVRGNMELRR